MKHLLVAICLLLTSCVQMEIQKVKEWNATAKAEAKAGNMKWSEYYLQLYDKINAIQGNAIGKGWYLGATNALIDASKAYEAGKVSKDEFESFQRDITAKEAEYNEAVRARQSQAAMAAYNQYLQSQALQAQSWNARRPINCISNKLGNTVNTQCY